MQIKFLKSGIILILLFIACNTRADDTLLFNGFTQKLDLNPCLQVLEDPHKEIEISKIIGNPHFTKQQGKSLKEIYLNYSESNYWIRFNVFNSSSFIQYVILADNNPRVIYDKIYIATEDSLIEITSPSVYENQPAYKVDNRRFISQLSLQPNTLHTFYLKIQSTGGPLNIALKLFSPSAFLNKIEIINRLNGIYYGILLTILLTSLLLWLGNMKLRTEKYNKYFFFYALAITLFSMAFDGYDIEFLWPARPDLNKNAVIITLLISFMAVSLFMADYFYKVKTKNSVRKLLQIIPVLSFLIIFLFLISVINYKTTVMLSFLMGYVLIVAGFILAISNYRSTPRFAFYFISSLIVIVICVTFIFIHLNSGYLSNDIQDISIKTGFAFMLILLTIGIAVRMRIQREKDYIEALDHLRKVKDKEAQSKQELEIQVQERTKLLTDHKTKLEEANKAINQQHRELEIAFKKSSHQHVKLQSALMQINEQKDSLENAFKKSSSQHVKLQKALRLINEQKEELEKANEEIKESSRLKEIFLANTSHEIRTPLNAIVGFTSLLEKTNVSTEQLKFIKNIKTSGENLMVIINDILDFSKIEAGKLSFEKIEFEIFELIEQLYETMKVRVQEKGIHLSYAIDKKISKVLIGDPYRLTQIMINLVGNAIKFTNKEGHIDINIVLENKQDHKEKIRFSIADNGIGISPQKLDNIFQSFTQAESDTTRKYGGTGLGLAIVKQLVELQHGNISVMSEAGKGSTFIFELTYQVGTVENIKKYVTSTDDISSDHFNDLKILLVEDNFINQQLAIDTIKSWNPNISIDTAITGFEAIKMLQNSSYHIVLMDIQMPEMDGIETTRHIRNEFDEPLNMIPIIAMTAHAMKEERETCKQIGMDDYITKPFLPDDLYRKIMYYAQKTYNNKEVAMELNTSSDQMNSNFDTSTKFAPLQKIYQSDTIKISKILKLYLETIPLEIQHLVDAYHEKNNQKIKNITHTLKAKMGYLGLLNAKNILSDIEIILSEKITEIDLVKEIDQIKTDWEIIRPEIEEYIKKAIN